jgi:hypothetical protein
VDILLAALAHQHDVAVLDYDGDYDRVRQRTRLTFDSVWLALRGSL